MYICTCHYVAYMPQVSHIFAIVATLLVISYNFYRHTYTMNLSVVDAIGRLSCLSFVTSVRGSLYTAVSGRAKDQG